MRDATGDESRAIRSVYAHKTAARPVREDGRSCGGAERDGSVERARIAGQLAANGELSGRGRPVIGADPDGRSEDRSSVSIEDREQASPVDDKMRGERLIGARTVDQRER